MAPTRNKPEFDLETQITAFTSYCKSLNHVCITLEVTEADVRAIEERATKLTGLLTE